MLVLKGAGLFVEGTWVVEVGVVTKVVLGELVSGKRKVDGIELFSLIGAVMRK